MEIPLTSHQLQQSFFLLTLMSTAALLLSKKAIRCALVVIRFIL